MAKKGGGHKSGGRSSGGGSRSSRSSSGGGSGYGSGASYGDEGAVGVIALFVIILIVLFVWWLLTLPSKTTAVEVTKWYALPEDFTPSMLPSSFTQNDSSCINNCVVYYEMSDYGLVAFKGDWVHEPTNPDPEVLTFFPKWSSVKLTARQFPTIFLGEGIWEPIPSNVTWKDIPDEYIAADDSCFQDCVISAYVPKLGGDSILSGDWVWTEAELVYYFYPEQVWKKSN